MTSQTPVSITELASLTLDEYKKRVSNITDIKILDELSYYLDNHDQLQNYWSKKNLIKNALELKRAKNEQPIFTPVTADVMHQPFYISPSDSVNSRIVLKDSANSPTQAILSISNPTYGGYFGAVVSGESNKILEFVEFLNRPNPNWNGLDEKELLNRILQMAKDYDLTIEHVNRPEDKFVEALAAELSKGLEEKKIAPAKNVYPIGINPALHQLWSAVFKQNKSQILKDDNVAMQWGRAIMLFSRAANKLGLPPFGKQFSDNIKEDGKLVGDKIINGNKEGCQLANKIFKDMSSINLTTRTLTQEHLHEVGSLNSLYYITTSMRFGLSKSALAHDVFNFLAKNFGFFPKKVGDSFSATKKLGFTTDVTIKPTESGKTVQIFITNWVTKDDACRLIGKPCERDETIKLLGKMARNWFRKNRLTL